jgi:hypothetical protein
MYPAYLEETDRKLKAVVCRFLKDGSEKSKTAAYMSLDALTGLLTVGKWMPPPVG